MIRNIKRLSQGEYDCIVVGGGINGAATADLAAKAGLKVALLEKKDFASGTSSKSTKLLHGGIRYLERFEFDLVHEALKERSIQLETAPHLVQPLAFVIPVYKNDQRPLWMMKIGVWLYDFLSGKYRIGRHKTLTKEEILGLEPALKSEDLKGGVLYYDAQMNDARLCLENVLSADQHGAHIANYVEVKEFHKENGKAVGIKAVDLLTKQTFSIRAKRIICAGGPWTNELLRIENKDAKKKVRLTKGIHIIYRGRLTQQALLLSVAKDNRIFFVIPWMGNSMIGTTDTDYAGDLNRVEANEKDIAYLLGEASRFFPEIKFSTEEIITTFAGLRPLVRRGGSPSAVSRKHVIWESYSGVLFVTGGKYTTYRKIAEDCVKKLKVPPPEHFELYGSGLNDGMSETTASEFSVPPETVQHLMNTYGSRYRDILSLTKKSPSLKNPICTCSATLAAEVVYSIRVEMAQTEEDIYQRRLGLEYRYCEAKECQKRIREILQKERRDKNSAKG